MADDDNNDQITDKDNILKNIKDITEELESEHGKIVNEELRLDLEVFEKAYLKDKNKDYVPGPIGTVRLSDEERKTKVYDKIIKLKEREMNKAVKELDFETAAILRDEIEVLKNRLEKITEEFTKTKN